MAAHREEIVTLSQALRYALRLVNLPYIQKNKIHNETKLTNYWLHSKITI